MKEKNSSTEVHKNEMMNTKKIEEKKKQNDKKQRCNDFCTVASLIDDIDLPFSLSLTHTINEHNQAHLFILK